MTKYMHSEVDTNRSKQSRPEEDKAFWGAVAGVTDDGLTLIVCGKDEGEEVYCCED